MGLDILNAFLTFTHVAIILIICLGWIWKKFHLLYVICNSCALFSWLILGFFKGYGYCLLTDIQWTLLESRGATNLPDTFIDYLFSAMNVSGFSFNTVEIINYFKVFIAITFVLRLSYIYLYDKAQMKTNHLS